MPAQSGRRRTPKMKAVWLSQATSDHAMNPLPLPLGCPVFQTCYRLANSRCRLCMRAPPLLQSLKLTFKTLKRASERECDEEPAREPASDQGEFRCQCAGGASLSRGE